jgi:hypothetical protein
MSVFVVYILWNEFKLDRASAGEEDAPPAGNRTRTPSEIEREETIGEKNSDHSKVRPFIIEFVQDSIKINFTVTAPQVGRPRWLRRVVGYKNPPTQHIFGPGLTQLRQLAFMHHARDHNCTCNYLRPSFRDRDLP